MAFLQLNSTNPELSFLINKNPSSLPLIKSIREGFSFAYYTEGLNTQYNIFFTDSPDTISFKDKSNPDFEYLSVNKYCSSFCYNSLINEYLSDSLRKQNVKDIDDIYQHSITFSCYELDYQDYFLIFNKYFSNSKIDFTLIGKDIYNVTITTNKSLTYLLSVTTVFTIFSTLINKEDIYFDDKLVEKYLKLIVSIDSPYFIRYLYKKNFLSSSSNKFVNFKKILDESSTNKYDFSIGDTHIQRYNHISKIITLDKSLIDLGCGEGFYSTRYGKQLKNDNKEFVIYSIDKDSEIIEDLKHTIRKKELEDYVYLFNDISEFLEIYTENEFSNNKMDVLLTEVIEHLEIDDAKYLIKQVVDNINFDKFVITTPNQSFNQFYIFDDNVDSRHHDHKFEFNEIEFQSFLSNIIDNNLYNIEISYCGDTVNNIQPTQVALITKK
jgi:hypothetical protein